MLVTGVKILNLLNRGRLCFPERIYHSDGGIGDELICSTVFRELKNRDARSVAFFTRYPKLFEGNSDVDYLLDRTHYFPQRLLYKGLVSGSLRYAHYDPDSDRDLHRPEHILALLCRAAGLVGKISLRPYLHLDLYERESGKIDNNQIVLQSSCMAAEHPMLNKEWDFTKMQKVCDVLDRDFRIIQLGSASDPQLRGALDLRGKNTLRQSAAILANSRCFIGPVGFLMHLARSVDCRAAIIYGGRENPEFTGYISNINLRSDLECSPCWQRNRCQIRRKCMEMIMPDAVVEAVYTQVSLQGKDLPVASVMLK